MRRIPRGRVATYGQVARAAGLPRHAQQVGYALRALTDGSAVPWHRVINAQGRISPRADPSWTLVQRRMLEAEGIRFMDDRVPLDRYGWTTSTPMEAPPMGKGDRKSRKGKIWRGSFGKRRPKKRKKATPAKGSDRAS